MRTFVEKGSGVIFFLASLQLKSTTQNIQKQLAHLLANSLNWILVNQETLGPDWY